MGVKGRVAFLKVIFRGMMNCNNNIIVWISGHDNRLDTKFDRMSDFSLNL